MLPRSRRCRAAAQRHRHCLRRQWRGAGGRQGSCVRARTPRGVEARGRQGGLILPGRSCSILQSADSCAILSRRVDGGSPLAPRSGVCVAGLGVGGCTGWCRPAQLCCAGGGLRAAATLQRAFVAVRYCAHAHAGARARAHTHTHTHTHTRTHTRTHTHTHTRTHSTHTHTRTHTHTHTHAYAPSCARS